MYEADQRHAEIIVGRLGLKDKRSVITPGVKAENQKDEEGDNEAMSSGEATEYRGLVARANCLSVDRLDIKYSVIRSRS